MVEEGAPGFVDDGLDDFLLEFASVGFAAVEGVGPDVFGCGGVDEADVDFKTGAGFLDAALEQGAGVEFLPNFGWGFVAVPVGLGGDSADHFQSVHVGQHGVEIIDDPLDDMIVLARCADIFERQNDNPVFVERLGFGLGGGCWLVGWFAQLGGRLLVAWFENINEREQGDDGDGGQRQGGRLGFALWLRG